MPDEKRTITCPACGSNVVVPKDEPEEPTEHTPSEPIPDD